MGEVAVTLNKRRYRLSCGDGEEARLMALAGYVQARLEKLASEFGNAGEERLLLMTALLITDELFELRESLGEAVATELPDGGAPKAARPRASRKSTAA